MDKVSSCLQQQTLGASNWPGFFPALGIAVQIQTAAAAAAAAVSAAGARKPEESSSKGGGKGQQH